MPRRGLSLKSSLYLMDFDAYKYGTMSLSEILNNPENQWGTVLLWQCSSPTMQRCRNVKSATDGYSFCL